MLGRSKSKGPATPVHETKKGGSFSVVGADAVITGNIATAQNLQLDGRIEGDVRCCVLHQGDHGTITGNIVADEARIAGTVEGRVEAKLLILEPSAEVTGDVFYETLSIAGGARVDGRFVHGVGGAAGPYEVSELFLEQQAAE